jgi:hypothetical protein
MKFDDARDVARSASAIEKSAIAVQITWDGRSYCPTYCLVGRWRRKDN